MSTVPTPVRGPLATVLIAFLVLLALLGAGAAALLVWGTAASVEPVAASQVR